MIHGVGLSRLPCSRGDHVVVLPVAAWGMNLGDSRLAIERSDAEHDRLPRLHAVEALLQGERLEGCQLLRHLQFSRWPEYRKGLEEVSSRKSLLSLFLTTCL